MAEQQALEARIAALSGASEAEVREVFAAYGLPLVSTPARPRSIRLVRLRVAGVRTGAVAPGAFDTTIGFDEGVTALVASNLRGKTSVLELVTWCLRGTPRELQDGVRMWLTHVDLDAVVAGQPMGFRLDIEGGAIVSASVLAGPDLATLAATRRPAPTEGVAALLLARDGVEFAQKVQALMLHRMDLQPLMSAHNGSTTQTHGWPAYFGAIYLPAAGDRVLLGDQAMAGLPGRLLQVFLDLPATAALARVKTVKELRSTAAKTEWAAAQSFSQKLAEQRGQVQGQLDAARARLAKATAAMEQPRNSLPELARRCRELAAAVADQQEEWEELMAAHRRARSERQQDAKLLNDVSESAVARRLFHGLNPTACPRCDQDIAEERRQRERTAHACAVCDRPVDAGDEETPEDVIAEAAERVAASSKAEAAAREALEAAETALDALTGQLEAAREQLRAAESARLLPEVVAAQEEVLRWEGALGVLPEHQEKRSAGPAETPEMAVLRIGARLLEDESRSSGEALFDALNQEIVALGRRFGMVALESVQIDRAGRLKVVKDGEAESWFSKLSAGERLRLRIAVVIALLRVGARYGVSTHPGLLLIDSPKAEEVQDLDAHALLRDLAAIGAENKIQIVLTTADRGLAQDVLQAGGIVQAAEGAPLW